jgi:hypothetical protein
MVAVFLDSGMRRNDGAGGMTGSVKSTHKFFARSIINRPCTIGARYKNSPALMCDNTEVVLQAYKKVGQNVI